MNDLSVGNLLKQKKEAKKNLSKDFSFSYKMPLLAVVLDKELKEKEEKILEKILEASSAIDIEVVVLADSNLDSISFPHTVILPYSQKARTRLLSAADIALAFDFSDVEEMMLNGTIPVSPQREELKNYDPKDESGNSFIYTEKSEWGVFAALVRALETFRLPYDWKGVVREGMEGM